MENIISFETVPFLDLYTDELSSINGGGTIFGIATGALAVATVALTIAFPPATGIALGAIVLGEVLAGVGGTVAAWNA